MITPYPLLIEAAGIVYPRGLFLKISYLCDPPEWNSKTNESSTKLEKSIFEIIIETFLNLLSKGLPLFH